MLTMDLLRHGALEGGVKYRGQTDDPLTTEGRLSMDHIWQRITADVDCIFSSPLSRCAGPAKTWAEQAGLDLIIEPRLAEMFYGDWEGKTKPEIQQLYPGMLEAWRKNPEGMRPPGGESPEELRARLGEWWSEMYPQLNGRHILLVGHSGSLRMLIALLMKQPIAFTRSLEMPYTCWSRFRCIDGENSLVFHNG